jgi:divalent anion:Na+ symporter, DASS family
MPDQRSSLVSRYVRLLACIVVALAVIASPRPPDISVEAWRVLGVFAAVIVSFILRPFPMAPMVLLGLITLAATRTVTLHDALLGYSDKVVWLTVAAFLFASVVLGTGLGYRIALTLVVWLGKSMLGLGYAICGAEFILGPIVPSNTARGGGTVGPIVRSLAEALGSRPDHEPERAGRYLVQVGAHANLIAAAMFLTGMGANPLVAKAAGDIFGVELTWGRWALGAIVPGLLGLAFLPLLVRALTKPSITDVAAARTAAREQLAAMGPWSGREKGVAAVFVGMLALWITNSLHGLGTTTVAWMGVCVLLFSGLEKWENVTANKSAWDTMVWLGGLLAMATLLRDNGLVEWFAGLSGEAVAGRNGVVVMVALALIYFYSMYGFSMLTGHITALVAAFFAVALSAGAPPQATVALLAYFSSLCGCLTNYSTGPFVIYFGFGYVPAREWFRNGFVMSLYHTTLWLTVGMAWWKVLGWW